VSELKQWALERFPVVYEGGEAKAVLVDIATFAQMELILDNLLNRASEPEDAVLAAAGVLQKLIKQARQAQPAADWERPT
jgi:hypothetical protein